MLCLRIYFLSCSKDNCVHCHACCLLKQKALDSICSYFSNRAINAIDRLHGPVWQLYALLKPCVAGVGMLAAVQLLRQLNTVLGMLLLLLMQASIPTCKPESEHGLLAPLVCFLPCMHMQTWKVRYSQAESALQHTQLEVRIPVLLCLCLCLAIQSPMLTCSYAHTTMAWRTCQAEMHATGKYTQCLGCNTISMQTSASQFKL